LSRSSESVSLAADKTTSSSSLSSTASLGSASDVVSHPPNPCLLRLRKRSDRTGNLRKRRARSWFFGRCQGRLRYSHRSKRLKYRRIRLLLQDGSDVTWAMSSQSALCGYTVIMALWAVQPPSVPAR